MKLALYIREFVPEVTLRLCHYQHPFRRCVMGAGVGLPLSRKYFQRWDGYCQSDCSEKNRSECRPYFLCVNGIIMLIAGLTFGWEYALASADTIFVSSRVTGAVFTKTKRIQAMIIASHPDRSD